MRMPRVPWRLDPALLRQFAPGAWNPDSDPVELYFLPDDFSQANNLAASNPDKVAELQALFWEEAEKYNVNAIWPRAHGTGLTARIGVRPSITAPLIADPSTCLLAHLGAVLVVPYHRVSDQSSPSRQRASASRAGLSVAVSTDGIVDESQGPFCLLHVHEAGAEGHRGNGISLR
jgi:hypothetical protein